MFFHYISKLFFWFAEQLGNQLMEAEHEMILGMTESEQAAKAHAKIEARNYTH